MKYPKLAPALERLHCKYECPAVCYGLGGRGPHDPIGAATEKRCGRSLRFCERKAGLARLPGLRRENQRPCLRCGSDRRPADRAHPHQRVEVLRPMLLAEILRMHG